jgi:hypothetical protein
LWTEYIVFHCNQMADHSNQVFQHRSPNSFGTAMSNFPIQHSRGTMCAVKHQLFSYVSYILIEPLTHVSIYIYIYIYIKASRIILCIITRNTSMIICFTHDMYYQSSMRKRTTAHQSVHPTPILPNLLYPLIVFPNLNLDFAYFTS